MSFSEVKTTCEMQMECGNATSYMNGTCKQGMCDYATEYEIENADNCNGENCSCCAMKGNECFLILRWIFVFVNEYSRGYLIVKNYKYINYNFIA